MFMKILARIKKYSAKSKFCDDWNKSVVGKMKDETAHVTVKESFRLKAKDIFIISR